MSEEEEVLGDEDVENLEEVDDPDAAGDELDEDFEGDEFADGEGTETEAADDEDEDEEEAAPAATKDDDDDEEPDPDDIEEDLDSILKDRLSSSDDDDDEDEEEDEQQVVKPKAPVVAEGDVAPRQEGEWTCMSCFLIVTKSGSSSTHCPHCGAPRS